MHDIDRTVNEFGNAETGMGEMGFEFGSAELGYGAEISSPFNEAQEMDLAAELLSVSGEEELNQFLGNLISRAAGAARSFAASPTGKALGGILRQAAKKALPVVGSAIGGYFGGSSGANFGRNMASGAGRFFGLELEGLSQEDQEFEMARQFVRFGGACARRAAQTPVSVNPVNTARQAAAVAAQHYLPGLAQQPAAFGPAAAMSGQSGRWYRRGNKIVIVGA